MFAGQPPAEVLIADDDAIARDVLSFYLETFGCRVQAARDGNEALAMYREGADWIGLVILDARMPGPPPIQMYQLIRQISLHIPILFCSGVPDDDPVIRAINEHGYQLLTKPFNRGMLHQAIIQATRIAESKAATACDG